VTRLPPEAPGTGEKTRVYGPASSALRNSQDWRRYFDSAPARVAVNPPLGLFNVAGRFPTDLFLRRWAWTLTRAMAISLVAQQLRLPPKGSPVHAHHEATDRR
jgi:hypothetical protein